MPTAAQTTTTSLSTALKTFYVNKFLDRYQAVIVAQKFGQSVPIDANTGKQANWYRYHPAAIQTAAATVEGDTAALTYKSFTGMSITADVETWNDQFEFSMLLYKTSRDPLLKQATEVMADQAAESIDWNTLYTIAEKGITCLPANAVSASTGAVTTTLVAEDCTLGTATTTALTVSASLGFTITMVAASASTLKGGWVTFTRGAAYGHASRISASTTASDGNPVITIQDAAPQAPVTATETSATGPATHVFVSSPFNSADIMTSSDIITTGCLRKAEEILFKNRARPFADGYYSVVIRPEVYTTLLGDTIWQQGMQYSNLSNLEKNEIGIWSKMKFFRSTTPANYAVASATLQSFSLIGNNTVGNGRLHLTYVFGQDAFGTVKLENSGFPEMNIETGPTKSDPNDLYGRMGWKVYWAVKPLNANFCVGIVSYA